MGASLLFHLSLLVLSAGLGDVERVLLEYRHDPACFTVAVYEPPTRTYTLAPRTSCPDAYPLWVNFSPFGPRVGWLPSANLSDRQVEILKRAATLYEPRFRQKLRFYIEQWSSAEEVEPAWRHNAEVFARAYSAYLHQPSLSKLSWEVKEYRETFDVGLSVAVPQGKLQRANTFWFDEEQPIPIPRW
jgi:hypothetical protein